ncbi:nuclear transport factor 2 family protein [Kineosporia sp. J2-2]|uniref:Nuclear transport factor 2 family protein n=1 Tax=Kineosporia corallincola TaxID=2835133 RepID=A0ABS5TRM2_9ACTN|nr:nuclear transport factor 2 family protein [Kineosporia corallincola]MBT0773440.1 nuclear transport factor 2 family protein [Kineosporia corallincola]
MTDLSAERVAGAWDSLATGDRDRILEFWHEDVTFEVPGTHAYSGLYRGIDAYVEFYGNLYRLSGGSLHGERTVILVNPEEGYSVDVNRISADRAGAGADPRPPWDRFELDALHLLRWQNGRIAEGHWMVFGEGATGSSLWWSPVDEHGNRRDVR